MRQHLLKIRTISYKKSSCLHNELLLKIKSEKRVFKVSRFLPVLFYVALPPHLAPLRTSLHKHTRLFLSFSNSEREIIQTDQKAEFTSLIVHVKQRTFTEYKGKLFTFSLWRLNFYYNCNFAAK